MKLSVQMTAVAAAIIAARGRGGALTGFASLGDVADPVQRADAQGFAWFWTFLGSVAAASGLLAWWIARTHKEEGDA